MSYNSPDSIDQVEPVKFRTPPIASMTLGAARPARFHARTSSKNVSKAGHCPAQSRPFRLTCSSGNWHAVSSDAKRTLSREASNRARNLSNKCAETSSAVRSGTFWQLLSVFGGVIGPVAGGIASVALAYAAATAVGQELSQRAAKVLPGVLFGRTPKNKDPGPSAAGGRGPAIVWFRNDLRLHDHEALVKANSEATSILPVYCFDLREYGRYNTGSNKDYRCGQHRARFIMESIKDLKARLQSMGSDLIVRLGRPENVLVDLVRRTQAGSVYCHGGVSHHEVQVEANVRAMLAQEGADLKKFSGNCLFVEEDLPFSLSSMPTRIDQFARKLASTPVREPFEAPDSLKGLPMGDVDPGKMPTMRQLGYRGDALRIPTHKTLANARGGEAEGLRHFLTLKKEVLAGRPVTGIEPFWLTMVSFLSLGCLSPRLIYQELQKNVSGSLQLFAADKKPSSSSRNAGTWVATSLMHIEFFRHMSRMYNEPEPAKQANPAAEVVTGQQVPALACA